MDKEVIDYDTSSDSIKLNHDDVSEDTDILQNDRWVTEIESTEGHLGTTLRAVYDAKQASTFLGRLHTRICQHDHDIERMCNHHYQGFVESIRSLLGVNEDAKQLKDDIQRSNEKLQKSGLHLLSKGETLIQHRNKQRNVDTAIDRLTYCLPVLETYAKLHEQMKSKRYYPALKTLEQLEHNHLPRVINYRFSKVMMLSMPHLRENIKQSSMSDLKDFLEQIRKHSQHIGETAMKHSAGQHQMDPSLAVKRAVKRKAPPPPNPITGEITKPVQSKNPFDEDSQEEYDDRSAQELINFSPIYRCLRIYSVLGEREVFEQYYRQQRRKQARLAVQPPPNMQETLEGYKQFFHEIIGFFVVEDHVLNTTTSLVNRTYLDDLWESSLAKIVSVLSMNIKCCEDAGLVLQLKNIVMLFCHTIRGYGFTGSILVEFLLEIRDHYCRILIEQWVVTFNEIFANDNYTPIQVEDQEEYNAVIDVFPFTDQSLEQDCFPKWFPFSQFVPKVYTQIKEYIYACLKFSDDLNLSSTEKALMLTRCFSYLCETLGSTLKLFVCKSHIALIQLVQICVNLTYLEQSCTSLESFISNIIGAEQDNTHNCKLHGSAIFKDARSEAEERIYQQINEKINEFFDYSDYDWELSEATGHASEYISDMIAYLKNTFESFTNLPEQVAQTACMSACKHIQTSLLDFLLDSNVKCISAPSIEQFNLDLLQCEQFTLSEPVPGFGDNILQMAFVDLRQLIDLFTIWDWEHFISNSGQITNRYKRVQLNAAISILEKLRESDKKKSNLFSQFKRQDKNRRKELENTLKLLKQLSNNNRILNSF